jgi:hypothetical protein
MTVIVALDTETTSLGPDRQVWEIGLIRRSGPTTDTWQCYVDVDLTNADPVSLDIGRFYDRHPQGQELSGKPVTDTAEGHHYVVTQLAKMTHKATIVGNVVNFDTEVLGKLMRAHGVLPTWHYHIVDVENLAVGYLRGLAILPDNTLEILDATRPPWHSEELSKLLDVDPPSERERHTALGDAAWALRIYDRIMRE